MAKTIKTKFDDVLTYQKLYEAYRRAKRDKAGRAEIFRFDQRLEVNLMNLLNMLKNGSYRPGKYAAFTVMEPKERVIHKLPFRDRIVHQWYIEEFIKPFFVPRFIATSFACIENRGTLLAADTAWKFLRTVGKLDQSAYIIKLDISKCFDNIDRNILSGLLRKRIAEQKLWDLTDILLEYNTINDTGLPIGNYTSQFFANIYLHEIDHFVKHVLKVKYYLRYMDNFVIFVYGNEDNKLVARELMCRVEQFVNDELNLELNHKSRYYPIYLGLDFCGWRMFEDYRLIRNRSVRKLHAIVRQYENSDKSESDVEKFQASARSWLAHARHGNTFRLRTKYLLRYYDILANRAERKSPLYKQWTTDLGSQVMESVTVKSS
jgi:retron-type reverse transcriptase